MDQLTKVRVIKLRHDPARIRVVSQSFCSVHDFADKAPTDIRNQFLLIPLKNILQISHCRFGERDARLGHQLEFESGSGLFQ